MSPFRIIDLLVLAAFVLPIPIVIYLQGGFYYYWDYATSIIESDPTKEVYDFIVVGSGSGAVVANRLSKNSKVLLLEAGGNPLWYNSIPGFALEMLNRPQVDWEYKTVPQEFSQYSMKNRIASWPRGKVLGGSSTLNYMLYVRGHPFDFDNWANLTQDNSWNYENLLPYFKKSLIYSGSYKENEKHYGSNSNPYGFLNVENRTGPQPLEKMAINAAKEVGLDELDLNGPQRIGVAPFEATMRKGARCSTYTAFLEPILDRKNLRILRYSHVTKIKLDSKGHARGVWFVRHGRKHYVSASREIILSAGSIDSPKLLMLSGIGPKKDLEKLGIKSRADLPVGHNLKDHIGSFITPIILEKPVTTMPEQHFGLHTFLDYFLHGSGDLTFPSLLHAQIFMTSSVAKRKNKNWPDLQLYFSYAGVYENLPKDINWLTGVDQAAFEYYLGPFKGQHGLSLGAALVRPKSVGKIRLKSRDPFDQPAIDPRYFEHPDDIKAIVEGIKFTLDLVEKTKAFKELGPKLPDIKWPGCEKHKLRSDEYWECYARHNGFTVYHPVGTCKMGKGISDPTAVVDTQLRCLKVTGLRVIDASVMPELVNGNTNAPTIMISEKGSDMIREYWSNQFLVCSKMERISIGLKLQKSSDQCFYSRLV